MAELSGSAPGSRKDGRRQFTTMRCTLALASLLASASIAAAQAAPSHVRVYAGTATSPNVTITVSPATATVAPGASVQFSATVTGTSNTRVAWTATGGAVSSAGTYTAGQTAGSYRVTATLLGGSLSGAATVSIQSTQSPGGIDILPGDNIQAKIDQQPTGTAFRFRAGVHRLSAPLTPRDGNTFTGDPGAIVSGARLLTNFTRSGSYWVVTGQSQEGPVHGTCRSESPRCNRPEDVYIDDVMIRHVGSLAEVGPGRWFFDYGNDRIYIGDDPTGRRVETTLLPYAFGGNAPHVSISGLIIEKFAVRAQMGAIQGDDTYRWNVRNNEIRFNHGVGIRIGHEMQVIGNNVHRNGQLGVGGVGNNVLIENNTIAYNNTAAYEAGWEAGGTKFAVTQNLTARGNFVHHNDGPGLWTDIDNINTLYEGNRVEDNAGMGIFHEISYAAIIRNNTVRRNGLSFTAWLWGAGILVAASPNVEIYGNTVEDNGDGITAVQQARGSGMYGPHEISNLYVHDNVVRMTQGQTGLAQDIGDTSYFSNRNVRFEGNDYAVTSGARSFAWANGDRTATEWRSYGFDAGGTFTTIP